MGRSRKSQGRWQVGNCRGETVDGADPCARLADVGEKVTDTQQTAKARSRGCRRETRLAVKDAVLSKHVFSSLFLLFSGDFTHL